MGAQNKSENQRNYDANADERWPEWPVHCVWLDESRTPPVLCLSRQNPGEKTLSMG